MARAEISAADLRASDVHAMAGAVVLEFGTSWCGWCRSAQPLISAAFDKHAQLRHIKVEDGPGKALGRHFGVKLWPTLVFLKDGQEIARIVRPASERAIADALAKTA